MAQYVNSEQDAKEYAPRYRLLYGLIGFTVTIFFMRLWFLQIINGTELRTFSEQNSIKETRIPAPRGIIYDRNGEILVENVPGFEATVYPQYLTDIQATSNAIGKVLDMPGVVVLETIKKSKRLNGPFRPVKIKDNLTRAEIFNIEILKHDYSGIDIRDNVVRSYPMKDDGAQLFGYVGEISKRQLDVVNEKFEGKFKFQQGDMIGKTGLEEVLDLYLRGKDGSSIQQVDARGREASKSSKLLGEISGVTPATPGNNVILTIDKDVQEAAYKSFSGTGRIGSVVAMKSDGEILAWVSSPSYDPNEFSTRISSQLWSKLLNDPDRPLRNKVIQDHNSPGSTFKPLIAIASLTEGVITPNTIISCASTLRFGNRVYHEHTREAAGSIPVASAVERSSNIFFYKMGIALGIDRMFKYCDQMGIGRKTDIDLQGERSGLMPSAEWKKNTIGEEWQPGENLSVAIGQGFVLTTPLQMAVAYNAIGTYGKVVKPFVVKKILTTDNKIIKEFEPTVVRDLSSPTTLGIKRETFDAVKEGMWRVVNGERGTARARAKLPYIDVAGKTGTSQVMSFSADQIFAKCDARPKHQRHHGWFIGYAPADNPEIAFGILAEHACSGAGGAAPIAREIVATYVAKYHPEGLARDNSKKGKTPGSIAPPVPPIDAVHEERVEGE